MSGPFDGITVLDLTRVLSGPYATMWLADMGADIIKVEKPGSGDDTRGYGPPFIEGEAAYFVSVNRNKRSMTLDFKTDRGKEVLWRLIEEADVLIENFRPGTLKDLGFGYQSVSRRNPEIIYTSISGFGQTGPDREKAGFDLTIQGLSGMMDITGQKDGPPTKMGVAIADLISGIYAAMGTSIALYHREKTGEGQHVDVGMLDSMISLLSYQAGRFFATGDAPERMGNFHPTISPYETFETKDGHMNLALGTDSMFERFCKLIDREDLLEDERFADNASRVEHQDEIHELLEEETRLKTTDEWTDLLDEAGIPAAPIKDLEEVFDDDQVQARNMVQRLQHPVAGLIKTTGIPIKMSESPGSVDEPPPTLGEHTKEILSETLGYDSEDIKGMIDNGIVDSESDET
ncbi:MAG: CaiB/BaiF CoA transferase family protein [bacterium]